jgi:hypothetical protein
VMLPVMLALTEPERGLDCGNTRNINYFSQFVKFFVIFFIIEATVDVL